MLGDNTIGIHLLKENKHGVDLPFLAMIGYVEIENFDFWHKKVNSWILDKEEPLKLTEIYKIAKLKSTHIKNEENTLPYSHINSTKLCKSERANILYTS